MAERISQKTWDTLVAAALAARGQAYAPYSRFQVGAALLAAGGEVVSGCNVENASFGLCLCAERNALTSAVTAGLHRGVRAMAIATDASPPAPPCGMCLQFMAELCEDLPLLLVNGSGERVETRLSALMAQPFRWKGAGTPHWEGEGGGQ